jgi:hypothetical protein
LPIFTSGPANRHVPRAIIYIRLSLFRGIS